MTRFAFALAFIAVLLISAGHAQTVDSRNEKTGKGIVFKVPDGVIPVDWNKSGFIGFLMLDKESPSGLFVAYPNNGGETIDSLRERIAKFVVPMFAHEDKEKKEFPFEKKSIPNHKGDLGDSGLYYSYASDKTAVQILFYEREGDTKNALYGYFSRKDKTSKKDPSTWADEKGNGVKILDKLWKSFK